MFLYTYKLTQILEKMLQLLKNWCEIFFRKKIRTFLLREAETWKLACRLFICPSKRSYPSKVAWPTLRPETTRPTISNGSVAAILGTNTVQHLNLKLKKKNILNSPQNFENQSIIFIYRKIANISCAYTKNFKKIFLAYNRDSIK